VLAVKPDQTLEYREITLGVNIESLRVVSAGLSAGDVIVVNGLSHVRAGMKITPTEVAMVPNRGLTQVAASASTPAALAIEGGRP
jgi:hypothetical protein